MIDRDKGYRQVGMCVVALSGRACHARLEGHACRARRNGMHNPIWRHGRDKRVPPRGEPDERVPPKGNSEGRACHAR